MAKQWEDGKTELYLDRVQISTFGDGETLCIGADTLLKSKGGDGYDDYHRNYLQPLGGCTTLLLKKVSKKRPGWYVVVKGITG